MSASMLCPFLQENLVHGSRMQTMGFSPSSAKSSTLFHVFLCVCIFCFALFFTLSNGFMVLSYWWLNFISFPSAQRASCLLHTPLVHQAGILEELCVVLASSWSMLASGDIEVWKVKSMHMCEVGLIFLDTKNVWKNEAWLGNSCNNPQVTWIPRKAVDRVH